MRLDLSVEVTVRIEYFKNVGEAASNTSTRSLGPKKEFASERRITEELAM
jgi:hypothetical protein